MTKIDIQKTRSAQKMRFLFKLILQTSITWKFS